MSSERTHQIEALIAERDHAVALADRYRTSIENAIQDLQDSAYTDLPVAARDALGSPERPACNVVAGQLITDICACGHKVGMHSRKDKDQPQPFPTKCVLCPAPETKQIGPICPIDGSRVYSMWNNDRTSSMYCSNRECPGEWTDTGEPDQ